MRIRSENTSLQTSNKIHWPGQSSTHTFVIVVVLAVVTSIIQMFQHILVLTSKRNGLNATFACIQLLNTSDSQILSSPKICLTFKAL